MANYTTTLLDDENNGMLPRTTLDSIMDSNGNYLDNQLTASDINALKNGAMSSLSTTVNDLYDNVSYTLYNCGVTSNRDLVARRVGNMLYVCGSITPSSNISYGSKIIEFSGIMWKHDSPFDITFFNHSNQVTEIGFTSDGKIIFANTTLTSGRAYIINAILPLVSWT